MGIAIVGMFESFVDAPWDDDKWEMWGMPWHPEYWVKMDRLFDIHEPTPAWDKLDEFTEKAKSISAPLYTRDQVNDYVTRYPIEKVEPYFESSMSYMIALAVEEGHKKIGLWGFGMHSDSEYAHQKANTEYWIGYARGQGVEVYIHPSSALCKQDHKYGDKEWQLPHTQN